MPKPHRLPGPSLRDLAAGVRISGRIGELWLHGEKAGLVYDWTLTGSAGVWQLEAERYKLDPLIYTNGCREAGVRLDIGPGRFSGTGDIWTDAISDGHTHKAIIVKGRNGQWHRKAAALSPRSTT